MREVFGGDSIRTADRDNFSVYSLNRVLPTNNRDQYVWIFSTRSDALAVFRSSGCVYQLNHEPRFEMSIPAKNSPFQRKIWRMAMGN